MSKKQFFFKYPKRKKGLPPGSLVYTGADVKHCEIALFRYGSAEFTKLPHEQLSTVLKEPGFIWLDVRGLGHVETISQIGQTLGMHVLSVEDVLNTNQRTKLEEYPNGMFFVMHYILWNEAHTMVSSEQIALHWNEKHVASFQEIPDDTFRPIIERMEDHTKRLRQSGTDYLAYALIDYIVDSHFDVLDIMAEKVQHVQERITPNADLHAIRSEIGNLRKQLSKLRRTLLPLRESLGKLARTDLKYVDPNNLIYFRDALDHAGQIIDYLENLYEDINTTHEMYTSEMDQRLNQVMKLLTIISTIFIPLSFIAGVYGMNFDNMPELRTKNGYYITLGVMAVSGLGMLTYFKIKKWF